MKNYHIYLGKYLSAFITTRWLQQQKMTKKAIFCYIVVVCVFLGTICWRLCWRRSPSFPFTMGGIRTADAAQCLSTLPRIQQWSMPDMLNPDRAHWSGIHMDLESIPPGLLNKLNRNKLSYRPCRWLDGFSFPGDKTHCCY